MSRTSALFAACSKRFSYATWMSLERGYLYVENPKVGCTMIKHVLQRLAGLPIPPNEQAIHYRNPPESFVDSALDHLDCLDHLIDEGLFIFTFVRNPKSRLISAYKDKILRSRGPFWEKYRNDIRELCALTDDSPITFGHFLVYVEATLDTQRDSHWRSQISLLRPDVIPYTFVGKFENFKSDFGEVLRAIDVVPGEIELQSMNSTENMGVESSEFNGFDDRIKKLYKQDFEFFGY